MENKNRVHRTKWMIREFTKDYLHIIDGEIKAYLEERLPSLIKQIPGCQLMGKMIEEDHYRLLMIIPTRYSVKEVADFLRCQTCIGIKKKFPYILERIPNDEHESYVCIWESNFVRTPLDDIEFQKMSQKWQEIGVK